ncbi:molybdopterin-dependent oxidoreductase [Paracoccus sp. NSM]|uniref:molybdopterin-dependent oxidoreductase n=1 Tax=Paracoccus sp. NSM TaxID=3457784 RepID=UPI004036E2F1
MFPNATSLALTATLFLSANAASAASVLTVTHGGETHEFDIAALQQMGTIDVTTSTIWTEGVQHFTGIPLATVLNEVGITEGSVAATAINDYSVEIPLDEITEEYPVIAFHVDGQPISVRDKGPFWIIYPFDLAPEWRSEVNFSRSIWQLTKLQPAD